jgi:CubicO group peptidase (beta-lactamase class C family)
VLLGLLIEEVTKMPFDQFLKEEVFQVASMKNTGYYELDRLPANTATSYIFDEQTEKYYSNIYSIDTKGTGAGGCFATSNDIHLFWKSLLNGEIISKELVNEMFSIQAEDGNSKYGYGFWIANKNDDFFPYFQGSDPGTSFISSYNLNRGINITILSNFEDNVWKIHKEILTDLLDN